MLGIGGDQAVVAHQLLSHLVIIRCRIFDSFIEGKQNIGLLVSRIESAGHLEISDSWTENCRIDNRYGNNVKVAFVAGVLNGQLTITNCSFKGALSSSNPMSSQMITTGTGKLVADNVTFDLSGVHYQCFYSPQSFTGSVEVKNEGKSCRFNPETIAKFAVCNDNTEKWKGME